MPRPGIERLVPQSSTRVSYTDTRYKISWKKMFYALCLGPTFKQVLSGPQHGIPDEKNVHKMLKLVS